MMSTCVAMVTCGADLSLAGYQMTYSKNHWLDDPQYKGINSRWETPDGGRFELQFHTQESFYAKEVLTHRSYDAASFTRSRAELSNARCMDYQCAGQRRRYRSPAKLLRFSDRQERI